MPISPRLAEPAGQTESRKHFEASFDIGTSLDAEVSGLEISVSPDNGQGGRQSYLRFKDVAGGVEVHVTDATFEQEKIATLDRASAHKVRFSMTFKRGADDVKISSTARRSGAARPGRTTTAGKAPSVSALLFAWAGASRQIPNRR